VINESSQTMHKLDEFIKKLDETDDYRAEQLTPVVLELTGKLGTLNRMAMHLVQSAIAEGGELEEKARGGETDAMQALERLKLGLRETSERVEHEIIRLKGKLELVHASLRVSNDILDYIARVRTLLTDSIWHD